MTGPVPVAIAPGDPLGPEAAALLAAHAVLLESLFPSEDNHHLAAEALAAPGIRFFLARCFGRAIGCAALAFRPGYGEVKSMFVAAEARGTGTGRALLARLEAEARAAGLPLLRLETGDVLNDARRLYAAAGFIPCGAFGSYAAGRTSRFMEKRLA